MVSRQNTQNGQGKMGTYTACFAPLETINALEYDSSDSLLDYDANEIRVDALVQRLHTRFTHTTPMTYSWVGPVLVSLNPNVPNAQMHNKKLIEYYHANTSTMGPPHIFTIAAAAHECRLLPTCIYQPSHSDKTSCVNILLSGISGAGKTECLKHILAYFCEVSRCNIQGLSPKHRNAYNNTYCTAKQTGFTAPRGSLVSEFLGTAESPPHVQTEGDNKIQGIISASQTVLEAFGNAKTIYNHNSSRFGQVIKMSFQGRRGKIMSCEISVPFLAKSRVCGEISGEQNFHAFYSFISTLSGEEDYHILRTGESADRHHHVQFETLQKALTTLLIPDEMQNCIWSYMEAILLLGDISFKTESDEISNEVRLSRFVELLNRSNGKDQKGLLKKYQKEINQDNETKTREFLEALSTHRVHDQVLLLDRQAVEDTKLQLLRYLYQQLFQFILISVNKGLSSQISEKNASVGSHSVCVVDMFGFEKYTKASDNSFDQLCINYADERLYKCYYDTLLGQERKLYEDNDVSWDCIQSVQDWNILTDFFSLKKKDSRTFNKPTGIFHILDDMCSSPNLQGNVIESKFAKSVTILHTAYITSMLTTKNRNKRQEMATRTRTDTSFVVYHVNGLVEYNATVCQNNSSIN